MQNVCVEILSYTCSCTNVTLFMCFQWRSVISKSGCTVLRTKEPPKVKEKKKERVIYKAPPIMCECGVKSNYDLVPSELGMGHYCGHMLEYDEVSYFCGKHEIVFYFFC